MVVHANYGYHIVDVSCSRNGCDVTAGIGSAAIHSTKCQFKSRPHVLSADWKVSYYQHFSLIESAGGFFKFICHTDV